MRQIHRNGAKQGAKKSPEITAAWIGGAFVVLASILGWFTCNKSEPSSTVVQQVDSGGRAAGRDYNEITNNYARDSISMTGKPVMDTRTGTLGILGDQYVLHLVSMNTGGRKIDNIMLRIYTWSANGKFFWTEPYPLDPNRVILPKDTLNHIHAFSLNEATKSELTGSYIFTIFKFRDVDDNEFDSTISFGKVLNTGVQMRYFSLSEDERNHMIKQLKRPGITEKSPFRFPL